MQDLIWVGEKLMPAPRTYRVDLQDIDSSDSGRSETGVMYRNRVRAGVYKILATWRVKQPNLNILIDTIKPAAFKVTFFDPNTASTQTCIMYAGDRSSTMIKNDDESEETWWDFSVNFIEY